MSRKTISIHHTEEQSGEVAKILLAEGIFCLRYKERTDVSSNCLGINQAIWRLRASIPMIRIEGV